MRKNYKYYDIVLAFFVAILLISNLSATKLIAFGSILTDGGAVLFPLAYIFGDVLTEVYGYKYARRAIWTGFAVMLLAVLSFTIVRFLPAAPIYTDQTAFEKILGFFPRIVVASLAAYLIGGFINAYVLAKLKVKMNGSRLWVRLLGSTVVGQFFDTLVFAIVAFGGVVANSELVVYGLVGWAFKSAVELLLLPITYRVIAWLKQRENVDNYDKKTKFTPFSYEVS